MASQLKLISSISSTCGINPNQTYLPRCLFHVRKTFQSCMQV